jgi:hypothetical protein
MDRLMIFLTGTLVALLLLFLGLWIFTDAGDFRMSVQGGGGEGEVLEVVWLEALENCRADIQSGSRSRDLSAYMDKGARERGYEDWEDLCQERAKALGAEKFQDLVRDLSEHTTRVMSRMP